MKSLELKYITRSVIAHIYSKHVCKRCGIGMLLTAYFAKFTDLGIRLKPMSMRWWSIESLLVLLNRANSGFVVTYFLRKAYSSLHFSAVFLACL